MTLQFDPEFGSEPLYNPTSLVYIPNLSLINHKSQVPTLNENPVLALQSIFIKVQLFLNNLEASIVNASCNLFD